MSDLDHRYLAIRRRKEPGPVCSSFSAKACAILQALCWSGQHHEVCHFSSFSCTIKLQWVPGYSFLPGNDAAELTRLEALLVISAIPYNLSPLISRIHFRFSADRKRTVSSKVLDTQLPSVSTEEFVLPRHACCVLSRLCYRLLLSSYLSRIDRIENPSCSSCGTRPGQLSSNSALSSYGLFAPLALR